MIRLVPVDASPWQELRILFDGHDLTLSLRWLETAYLWTLDVYDHGLARYAIQGMALVHGAPLLWRSARPYIFFVGDESGLSLDPASAADLGGRCPLYIATRDFVPSLPYDIQSPPVSVRADGGVWVENGWVAPPGWVERIR